MSAERHLGILENNCLLDTVDGIPTPHRSNFYWINSVQNQFKAFIPTPNRDIYYNLEEYVGDIHIKDGVVQEWRRAVKSILFAVSVTDPADQPFMKQMEMFVAKTQSGNDDSWFQYPQYIINESVVKDNESLYKRHYLLTKYLVDDIKNVNVKNRWHFAVYRASISVNPSDDPAGVIHEMDIAFERAAERFVNDTAYGVYGYPNNRNN